MNKSLHFNPALETPAPGSLLDRYQQGGISAYALNWAFICGLDVANPSALDTVAATDTANEALCHALEAGTTRPFRDGDVFGDSALIQARSVLEIG